MSGNIIEKCIEIIKLNGFGTKNLPDAMKWHCSYFWKHALSDFEIKHSVTTYKILNRSIAIPILLSKPIQSYEKLGEDLQNLLN